MTSNKKFIFLSVFITMGYVAFFIFSYIAQKVLGFEYPVGSFLFKLNEVFSDFYDINTMLSNMSPYIEYDSSYPPIALVLAIPFALLQKYIGMIAYPVMVLICVTVIFIFKFKILRKHIDRFSSGMLVAEVSIPLLVTAPFIFMFDRGNYLLLTITFFYVFVYFYYVKPNDVLSSVMLAFMIAGKIYPALLLFLLIFDKKWKNFFLTVGVTIGITLLGFCFFQEGFFANFVAFLGNLFDFASGSGDEAANVYFSVGLTALLRFPFVVWNGIKIPEWYPVGYIYVIIAVILVLWSFWNFRKEESSWKKLMLLTVLMVFLTPNSYMYNLTYLLPVMLIFIIKDVSVWKFENYLYAISFGILNIPKAYYYFSIDDKYVDVPTYAIVYSEELGEYVQYDWVFPKDMISIQVLIDGFILFGIILFYNICMSKKKKRG